MCTRPHAPAHAHAQMLITEAVASPARHREALAAYLFETQRVPALHVATPAALALYGAGRTTGVVVDVGDGVSSCTPVYEGARAVPRISRALALAAVAAVVTATTVVGAGATTAADSPQQQLFHLRRVAGATCADGSPFLMYARNCSANWDAKPGEDYCGGSQEGTALIVFMSGSASELPLGNGTGPLPRAAVEGAYCYDEASCSARAAACPNCTTSALLPQLGGAAAHNRTALLTAGMASPFAEVNPNLYKSPAFIALISCSRALACAQGW